MDSVRIEKATFGRKIDDFKYKPDYPLAKEKKDITDLIKSRSFVEDIHHLGKLFRYNLSIYSDRFKDDPDGNFSSFHEFVRGADKELAKKHSLGIGKLLMSTLMW